MTIHNDPLPDGVRSTLVIPEANERDFSSFNCSVANEYGMDANEITLKRRSKFFYIVYEPYRLHMLISFFSLDS